MRIVVCWPVINGYMAACWKALNARPGIDVAVIAYDPAKDSQTAYQRDLLDGLTYTYLSPDEQRTPDRLNEVLAGYEPDLVYVPGWGHPPYNSLPKNPTFARVPMVMGMDTPWLATMRQQLAFLKAKPYFKRMSRVLAIGERAFQAATRMGAPERKVRRYMYAGIDDTLLRPSYERRIGRPDGYPRSFVFLGRYVEVKALDVLIEAYKQYRRQRPNGTFGLTCCGKGPLGDQLKGVAGVEDRGFVQPADLPELLSNQGVFVNAARYDPWPLVIVEACAAGLPVISSEACGSAVELIRPCYNGLTVATGEVGPLRDAMCWMHDHYDDLPEMGRRSQQLAEPFGAEQWAIRWQQMAEEIAAEGGPPAA